MGWRNEYDIKNIEIKSVENGGATININKVETDKLAKAFLRDFLVGKKIEYINNALKLRNKKFIENYMMENMKNMYSFMWIIETSQILKERAGIDIEEALREKLIENERLFSLTDIIRVFKNLQFTKEEQEKIIKKRLEQSRYPLDEDLDALKGEYRDIASDFLNKNVSIILHKIGSRWHSFDKVGRGFYFEMVRNRLICLSKHRDLLTAENEKKICDFLLERDTEGIIKRRIKKKKHQKYIKALLSFLPDKFKRKYLAYLI